MATRRASRSLKPPWSKKLAARTRAPSRVGMGNPGACWGGGVWPGRALWARGPRRAPEGRGSGMADPAGAAAGTVALVAGSLQRRSLAPMRRRTAEWAPLLQPKEVGALAHPVLEPAMPLGQAGIPVAAPRRPRRGVAGRSVDQLQQGK